MTARAFALIGLLATGGTCAAQVLGGHWCDTEEVWRARHQRGGPVPAGVCPLLGECDDPAARDAAIPDASTPLQTVRVHFLVFREDDGSHPAASAQDVVAQAATMHANFAPWRIQFEVSWQFVDDTRYRYLESFDEIDPMKLAYAVAPAVQCNIFVTDLPAGLGGRGTFPWDSNALGPLGGIILDEVFFGAGMTVATHEMGHNLGLWHTHHGVDEVPTCGPCYEFPGGSQGDTTGDFCQDTPPTPTNWTCADPAALDLCTGLPWGPTAPQNYLSYGGPGCWSEFTPQQAGRLHCWMLAVLGTWLSCPADLDGDGTVSLPDLLALLAAWGTSPAGPPDLDLDGTVAAGDLLALLTAWGPC